jgi:hypothetical protein
MPVDTRCSEPTPGCNGKPSSKPRLKASPPLRELLHRGYRTRPSETPSNGRLKTDTKPPDAVTYLSLLEEAKHPTLHGCGPRSRHVTLPKQAYLPSGS